MLGCIQCVRSKVKSLPFTCLAFLYWFRKNVWHWPLLSTATIMFARGSMNSFIGSTSPLIAIYFTVFAFCLLSFTSQRVIRLFVASTKLKSSPNTNDISRIAEAFGNQNLTSSACLYFKNSSVISVAAIYRARHVLEGWIAQDRKFSLIMLVSRQLDLLGCGKVESEGYGGLLAHSLVLFPHDEVAIVVEDQLVGEVIEE